MMLCVSGVYILLWGLWSDADGKSEMEDGHSFTGLWL